MYINCRQPETGKIQISVDLEGLSPTGYRPDEQRTFEQSNEQLFVLNMTSRSLCAR
jgi:hypothetical protein